MENTNDLVVLGRTGGAYGVRGWLRVFPTETGEVLLAAKNWFLIRPTGEMTPVRVKACRPHGTGLIAQWEGCESKEAADALRGQVAVRRDDFPDAGEDAVWAVDLVGCEVVNREGVTLGKIEGSARTACRTSFRSVGSVPTASARPSSSRTCPTCTSSKSTSKRSASRSTGIPSGAEGDRHAF